MDSELLGNAIIKQRIHDIISCKSSDKNPIEISPMNHHHDTMKPMVFWDGIDKYGKNLKKPKKEVADNIVRDGNNLNEKPVGSNLNLYEVKPEFIYDDDAYFGIPKRNIYGVLTPNLVAKTIIDNKLEESLQLSMTAAQAAQVPPQRRRSHAQAVG